MDKKKRGMGAYLNMGTAIGACAAIGIVLGALLHNLVLWLVLGAALGVVLGGVIELYKKKS